MTLPETYTALNLPSIRLLHHPASSPTVTPVIIVQLHRPAARNAFTQTMARSLVAAFDTLSRDPRVRVVVLASSDPMGRVFCAGMDLNGDDDQDNNNPNNTNNNSNSLGSHDEKSNEGNISASASAAAAAAAAASYRDHGGSVSLAIHNCTKPTIAAISGAAVGIGITMTLPFTIRLAARSSPIGFVFGRRGICLEACSSFFLPRLIGSGRALHLVSTGSLYRADHPLLDGLFSQLVDEPGDVLPAALAIADDMAVNVGAVATRLSRDLIYRGPRSPEEAHLLESRLFQELVASRDACEGRESFLEKRPPRFMDTMDDAPASYPWWNTVDVRARSKI